MITRSWNHGLSPLFLKPTTKPSGLAVPEAKVILPVEGYPVSTEAIREWFRRTHGREASDREVGEIQDRLAGRDSGPAPPQDDRADNE